MNKSGADEVGEQLDYVQRALNGGAFEKMAREGGER